MKNTYFKIIFLSLNKFTHNFFKVIFLISLKLYKQIEYTHTDFVFHSIFM